MKYTFQDAFAEILAHNVPEYFWQKTRSGELEFAVPGWDVTTVDYAIALALGKAPLSDKLNLRRISSGLDNFKSPFTVNKYLAERGDERIKDWASWVANAKWENDAQRAGSKNAVGWEDFRSSPDTMSYLKMQTAMRLVILKVMNENNVDFFINPENTLPPFKIGGPDEPVANGRPSDSCCAQFTALIGGPEIDVPAGYVETVYEPHYVLSPDKKTYSTVTGTTPSKLPHPMPISLMFWGGPGSDSVLIKAASAYEAATHHRVPPAAFGPVAGEP
jgi:Asp-tRNA(Asn)/Glu-tRNA(Gln) amidotransferase A subunit family amidase